ncbi:hypothetical protein [Brevundimonas sp. LM2]|uniref:hypothetical protein n=1 Tax=Brevundimonas sp. LM2 TaxID=1938605 RepID=UPI0012373DB6|nr:hypothetical protein [Brevundimonas sp. LM2]
MAWTQASEPIRRQARAPADGRPRRHRDERKPAPAPGARSGARDIALRGLVVVISLGQIVMLVWTLTGLPLGR